jgi:hypothetical protein
MTTARGGRQFRDQLKNVAEQSYGDLGYQDAGILRSILPLTRCLACDYEIIPLQERIKAVGATARCKRRLR